MTTLCKKIACLGTWSWYWSEEEIYVNTQSWTKLEVQRLDMSRGEVVMRYNINFGNICTDNNTQQEKKPKKKGQGKEKKGRN